MHLVLTFSHPYVGSIVVPEDSAEERRQETQDVRDATWERLNAEIIRGKTTPYYLLKCQPGFERIQVGLLKGRAGFLIYQMSKLKR